MSYHPPFIRVARPLLLCGLALLPLAGAVAAPKAAVKSASAALVIAPAKVVLNGPYAGARLLVNGASGSVVSDQSGQATFTVSDPKVASVDSAGMVWPVGDGKAVVTAKVKNRTARVPIEVSGVAKTAPPRFAVDVIPVLTHAGCNQGGCHGAGAGKGGFKLSLLGYDPDADYEAITRASGARRISRTDPENSLLLRKATFKVPHKGGFRFAVDSPEYRILRDWIAGGLPAPAADEPKVTRLEVIPPVRTLAPGQTQRFIVKAKYSDGTQRDATSETLFTASDESVATVSPGGEAKVTGSGEGAVLIRYQGLVATARVISPYNLNNAGVKTSGRSTVHSASLTKSIENQKSKIENPLDRLVLQKLDALGLEPSGNCTDADFLRRATLDVIGLLPTPEEARKFLADRDPKKREKLVDSLLNRPEYTDFWTMKWGDLLRSSRQSLTDKGMASLNGWIRQSVEENKPWDEFARELLLAQGSAYSDGPANYYRSSTSPQELAETTSQAFLGVRIQCAKCHNHPYEKWTQNQYYQMAAFFARIKSKAGERKGETVVYVSNAGEVTHPKTQKQMTPCALDATPLPKDFNADRRQGLAEWMTSPQNPFFAKIIVNRLWKHFLGRGLVEPVDDLRVTNPPSNEALFDYLAQDLVKHHYDLKYLMRSILLSQTYQRSPEATKRNERDSKYYSHYAFKRLGAEQLLDALASATGVSEKFDGYPAGTHASQLPDTTVPSYFLELFGRPARNITCECERTDAPNLGQVLHLMNNAGINGRLSNKTGRVATLVAAKLPDSKMVEEFYLATYARYPTPAETGKAVQVLATAKDRQKAAEDLFWALMNSNEFIFNH